MPTPRPRHRTRRLLAAVVTAAMALGLLPTAVAAEQAALLDAECGGEGLQQAVGSPTVPDPTVIGPVTGGIRTQEPYGTTLEPLAPGYVEEEFFIDGTATAVAGDGSTAPYQTRIVVRRPTDPGAFNGTVILDWTNVTIPDDTDASWAPMAHMVMARGYAYVSVAAQRLGVELSPLALKQWDPVRYRSLSHPGDDYSYDMFSQAGEAVLDARVMGDLAPCVERRLAIGASQSRGRLKTYINEVHPTAQVFDGFQPQIASPAGVDRDGDPVLWVNSMSEAADVDSTPPDSGSFRLWEIAGPAHTTQEYNAYTNAQIVYAHSNGAIDSYDREDASEWGYRQTPGLCAVRNRYQVKFAWSAALVALDDWVRTGVPPAPQPRLARDDSGRLYDEHGNQLGGIRGPLLEVPIAAYFGGDVPEATEPCGAVGGRLPLTGLTRVFDAATIAELYDSGAEYEQRFREAVDAALEQGWMLPEGAELLLSRLDQARDFVDEQIAAASADARRRLIGL